MFHGDKFVYVVLLYILILNLLGFCLCVYDKSRAIKGKFRVPEKRLFLTAFLGGAAGVYAGMLIARHKTKHMQFVVGIPILILWNAAALYFLFAYLK